MNKQEAIAAVKILKALTKIGEASIILNTFINTFKNKSIHDITGQYYLQGNFNINGTVSGRWSSSHP